MGRLTQKESLLLAGMVCVLWRLFALPVAADEPERPKPASDLVREDWQVLEIGGKRIGYAHTVYRKRRDEPTLEVKQTSEMKFQRFGKDIELKTILETTESVNGDLQSYRFEIQNPPSRPSIQIGTVNGQYLELELTVNDRTSKRKEQWTPGTKSPLYQERAFVGRAVRDHEQIKFTVWQPELSKTGTMLLRTETVRDTPLFGDKRARLMKVAVENTAIPTQRLSGYLDAEGRWYKTETDFFGKTLTTYLAPAEEALKEIVGTELDLAMSTVVAVTELRSPFTSPSVTYRIKLEKDNPADFFPNDAWQKVKTIDGNTIELTVIAPKPPPRSAVSRPAGDEYLKSTAFLQVDDSRVQRLALSGAANHTDPLRIGESMERYVFDKIESKTFSTALASAAEVAESLEGDCTEHAMLLAAMLRARGIPSRVCVGLVYSEGLSGFVGHMWTEAWVRDRWMPLDATLARRGIGRGHLKLSDSSLGESAPAPVTAFLPLMRILGQMEIEVVHEGAVNRNSTRSPGN